MSGFGAACLRCSACVPLQPGLPGEGSVPLLRVVRVQPKGPKKASRWRTVSGPHQSRSPVWSPRLQG
eukprot:1072307-Alexandrium_andersonii.AAC.1